MRRFTISLSCALAAAVFAVAPVSPTAAAPDPCAMFDAKSVGHVFGKTAGGPKKKIMSPFYTGCSFTVGGIPVPITIQQSELAKDTQHDLSAAVKAFSSPTDVPHRLPGVGDEAYSIGSSVFMRKGLRYAVISVIENPSKALADAIAIARTAH